MEIANEFLTYLFTYGELTLPGIGRFYLKKIPSKLASHEKKIYGPTIIIEFEEDLGAESTGISKVLKHKYSWSRSKADRKLSKTTNAILNHLINLKVYAIQGFGKFEMDENGKLLFQKDKELKRSLDILYPDLDIKYIKIEQKTSGTQSIDLPPGFSPTYQKKVKIGWFFPLLALVATSFLFACIISCYMEKNFERKKGLFSVLLPSSENSETNQNDVKNDSFSDLFENNDSSTQDDSTSVLSEETDLEVQDPSEFEDSADFDAYLESYENQEQTKTIENIIKNEEQTELENNFRDVVNMSLDQILQISAAKRNSMSDPCMIVVGSYQRRDLLDKMSNKLNQLGHNIYVEKYGSFYRTAIIYECKTRSKKAFLAEIRTQIDKNAWILTY
jgi:hypothetical protein